MPESLTFCGRTFRADELELMRQMSREYSALGVTEIARTVCELLNWTRPNGGLKNHECRQLLERLSARGLMLYLASGTDEPPVKAEAALLDVARYFGPRIYGAQEDYHNFSKKMVIDRILREHAISGERLLAFGDGYVEIENTKGVGGLAVAVASD